MFVKGEAIFQGLVTFLYASNHGDERQRVWQQLQAMSRGITEPWLIIGDFNVVLNATEKIREDGRVGTIGA